jgi:hypothetical protein
MKQKLSATYFDDKSKTSVIDFDFRWKIILKQAQQQQRKLISRE